MNKSEVYKHSPDSAEYVVTHALWQKSRGRSPSLTFCLISNPRKALAFAQRIAYFPVSGAYLNGEVPNNYKCVKCGATNCKLWREYNTCLEYQRLLCATCAGADQEKDVTSIDADGKISVEHLGKTDQIGWMVPAVPTEECDTYWGYTSVPQAGCEWWRMLPSLPSVAIHSKKSSQTTLVSEEELERRCREERIDFSKVIVIAPRWAETSPRKKGTMSALVRCDLIIRSDGSAVALDGAMGGDSISLIENHTKGEANPNNLPWEEYIKSIVQLPK